MLFFSRVRAHMGEITAEITGLKAQQILSIAHDAGITLYNVRRLAYTRICATLNIHEYFKLRRLLRRIPTGFRWFPAGGCCGCCSGFAAATA